MKIEIEKQTVNGIDDCLILKKPRGKFTDKEIAETLENYPYADGCYVELHKNPSWYGEIDPSLYDEGDVVVLYLVENFMQNQQATRAIPMILRPNNECPLCGSEITQSDYDYCPYCGQKLKRNKIVESMHV